ncbi:DUF2834 domain-containing protein [Vibrio sonorensis]|uniref:DUF2834 domain-containing protein n=1 Tax=Vibrio sonorensis TaxID=1004316 RepID=UPI0008DB1F02|nr:DUF2834 domain-containing protein [Vibrio sonorensis]
MNIRFVYLVLAVVGTVLPYGALFPWLVENGLDLPLLVSDIASHPLSLVAWLDVVVAAVALLLFAKIDSQRHGISGFWLVLVTTLTIGVSCGLPLYLYFRERDLSKQL